MTRNEARFHHLANLLVGGTGAVYAWMRYALEPADEFALVNHPLEPHVLHAHLLAAPLLVFAVALVWREHVWKRVQSAFRARRRTGLALFVLFFPMVFSGVLLQTSASELGRRLALGVHLATSGAWVVAYLVHQLSARGGAASAGPPADGAAPLKRPRR